MDYRTAAALSQNIAGIGDMFMQMNDPATRAKAALVGNQNALLGAQVEGQKIDNQYAPGKNTATIFATNANGTQSLANARQSDAQAANWNIRNRAGEAAMSSINPPLTTYSTGAAAGGQDEMQDRLTNEGYTATGKNLTPGVVAVGSRDQLGAVYQDQNGRAYIAADLHGNKNKGVVDIYQEGLNYNPNSVQGLQLRQVGQEKIPYGTTPEQLAAHRAKYERQAGLSNIFSGGGAADLASGVGKMAALTAQDELDMRRALGAQGQVMGQGEYFDPAASTAFQTRDLANNLNQETLRQKSEMLQAGVKEDGLNRRAVFDALNSGMGLAGVGTRTGGGSNDPFDGAEPLSKASLFRFSLDGATMGQSDLPKAQAWEASVAALTSKNVPFAIAKMVADKHHGLPVTEDGMFSSPQQTYTNFNPAILSPEQVAQVAATYGRQGAAGGNPQQIIANAAQLFNFGGQPPAEQAPAPAQQPTPVATQPAAMPQTGVVAANKPKSASDGFKRRESSTEQKAHEGKSKRIAEIQRDMQEIAGRLQSGQVSTPAASFPAGGMGQAYASGPSKLSNDNYNTHIDRLKALEAELAQLQAVPQTAAQGGAVIDNLVNKYQ